MLMKRQSEKPWALWVVSASAVGSAAAERLSWVLSLTMRRTASLHKMGDCFTSRSSACNDADAANGACGSAACRPWSGIKANHSMANNKPVFRFTLQSYKICVRPRQGVKKTSPELHIGLSLWHDNQPTHHHRHPAVFVRLVVPHVVFQHSNWTRMAAVGKQRFGFVFYNTAGDVWLVCAR